MEYYQSYGEVSTAARLRDIAKSLEREERKRNQQYEEQQLKVKRLKVEKSQLQSKLNSLEERNNELQNALNKIKAKTHALELQLQKERDTQIAGRRIAGLLLENSQLKAKIELDDRKLKDKTAEVNIIGSKEETENKSTALFHWKEGGDHSTIKEEFTFSPESLIEAAKSGFTDLISSFLGQKSAEHDGFFSKIFVTSDQLLENTLNKALMESVNTNLTPKSLKELIKLLVSNGASLKYQAPGSKRTVLHQICLKDDSELINLVLSYANTLIDVFDANGLSPLHLSARFKKETALEVLIQNGANLDLTTGDKVGLTARQLYESENSFSMHSILGTKTNPFENITNLFWNFLRRGTNFNKQADYNEAFIFFTKAITLRQENSGTLKITKVDISRLYYNRAKVATKIGEYVIAMEDLSTAIGLDNSYHKAIELLGEVHFKLFDFSRSVEAYKKLVDNFVVFDEEKTKFWKQSLLTAERCVAATHYDVLNLKQNYRTVTETDVKRAFKIESMKWHPDKHNKTPEDKLRANLHFQRINAAKTCLVNKTERANYEYDNRSKLNPIDFVRTMDTQVFPWSGNSANKSFYEIKRETQRKTESAATEDAEVEVDDNENSSGETSVHTNGKDRPAPESKMEVGLDNNSDGENESDQEVEKLNRFLKELEKDPDVFEDDGVDADSKRNYFSDDAVNTETKVDLDVSNYSNLTSFLSTPVVDNAYDENPFSTPKNSNTVTGEPLGQSESNDMFDAVFSSGGFRIDKRKFKSRRGRKLKVDLGVKESPFVTASNIVQ